MQLLLGLKHHRQHSQPQRAAARRLRPHGTHHTYTTPNLIFELIKLWLVVVVIVEVRQEMGFLFFSGTTINRRQTKIFDKIEKLNDGPKNRKPYLFLFRYR